MRQTSKPIRKCHACLLNLGDRCWLYRYPRGQWRGHRQCRAFENPETYNAYRAWLKQPTVMSRKELRRRFFRSRSRRRADTLAWSHEQET
jgi:hypothetical protein